MKFTILLYILLLSALVQSDNLQFIKNLSGDFKSVKLDELGNIFLTNKKHHLIKLSPQLDTLFVFSEKNTEVDQFQIQNALKILIFNEHLNTVQYLDKTLSNTTDVISLDAANVKLSGALGVSRDNNFWVFDENEQMLKKFNSNLQEISSSGNLLNITGESYFPQKLLEQNNKVYISDSTKGLIEFDFFGNYLSTYPIYLKGNFKSTANHFLYISSDTLVVQEKLLLDTKKIPLPVKNIIDFDFSNDKLYLLNQEKLYIYQLSF